MSLSSRLARDFPVAVRRRGEEYHWQRLVRIEQGSDAKVEAIIRGSQQYEVELSSWETAVMSVSCPCAESNGPCKHLWATILTAEARGFLSSAANDDTLTLDDALGAGPIPGSEALSTVKPKPVLATKSAAWRHQLAGIAQPEPRSKWQTAAWLCLQARRFSMWRMCLPAS